MSCQVAEAVRSIPMPTDTEVTSATAPDGRARRWDEHKAERRDLILTAAIEMIREQGGEVAVQEIADRAGLPRSVVYRVFRDREDLDEQIRGRIVDLLMDVLAPKLVPQGTVQDAISGAIHTYVGWVREFPLLHLFLGTGSAQRRTTGSRVVTGTKTAIAVQLKDMIATVLAASAADPSIAESLAFGLVGLVDGTVNRWVNNPEPALSADALGVFLSAAIWEVLRRTAEDAGVTLTLDSRLADLF